MFPHRYFYWPLIQSLLVSGISFNRCALGGDGKAAEVNIDSGALGLLNQSPLCHGLPFPRSRDNDNLTFKTDSRSLGTDTCRQALPQPEKQGRSLMRGHAAGNSAVAPSQRVTTVQCLREPAEVACARCVDFPSHNYAVNKSWGCHSMLFLLHGSRISSFFSPASLFSSSDLSRPRIPDPAILRPIFISHILYQKRYHHPLQVILSSFPWLPTVRSRIHRSTSSPNNRDR